MPLAGGEQRIPILSPVIHCCAMTVLVFFRSSFGFSFLRPEKRLFRLLLGICTLHGLRLE